MVSYELRGRSASRISYFSNKEGVGNNDKDRLRLISGHEATRTTALVLLAGAGKGQGPLLSNGWPFLLADSTQQPFNASLPDRHQRNNESGRFFFADAEGSDEQTAVSDVELGCTSTALLLPRNPIHSPGSIPCSLSEAYRLLSVFPASRHGVMDMNLWTLISDPVGQLLHVELWISGYPTQHSATLFMFDSMCL